MRSDAHWLFMNLFCCWIIWNPVDITAQVEEFTDIDDRAGSIAQPTLVDIDGDDLMDIVVPSGSHIKWYENLGQGQFSQAKIIPESADLLAVSNLVGDKGDIILARSNGNTYEIAILYHEATIGVFSVRVSILSDLPVVRELKLADMDGDGDEDIVVATRDEVFWMKNDGGIFVTDPNLIASVQALHIHISDWNKDNNLDIVFTELPSNIGFGENSRLTYMLGNGSGTFAEKQTIAETPDYAALLTRSGDFDGDGDLDLVSIGEAFPVRWFPFNDSLFGAPIVIDSASFSFDVQMPTNLSAHDYDQDGDTDLLVNYDVVGTQEREVWLFKNNQGIFQLEETYGGFRFNYDVLMDDLNADGRQDFVFASFSDQYLGWTGVPQEVTSTVLSDVETVKIWPNPTDGILSIDFPEGFHVDLYDALGRLVLAVSDGDRDLDLVGMKDGIYFLVVRSWDGKVWGRSRVKKVRTLSF